MEVLGVHNFYTGTHNGLKLEIRSWGILIHTLELKLWHFEESPYVCIGKPHICNVLSPGVRYLENR